MIICWKNGRSTFLICRRFWDTRPHAIRRGGQGIKHWAIIGDGEEMLQNVQLFPSIGKFKSTVVEEYRITSLDKYSYFYIAQYIEAF